MKIKEKTQSCKPLFFYKFLVKIKKKKQLWNASFLLFNYMLLNTTCFWELCFQVLANLEWLWFASCRCIHWCKYWNRALRHASSHTSSSPAQSPANSTCEAIWFRPWYACCTCKYRHSSYYNYPQWTAPRNWSITTAANWVSQNVVAHYPATNIAAICVGSEVFTTLPNAAKVLVNAFKYIHSALVASNLDRQIKVSTPLSSSIILDSFPPSQAFFNSSLDPVLVPMLKFLQSTGSFLMLNVYPYYDYMQANGVIPSDYSLFKSLAPNKDAVDSMLWTRQCCCTCNLRFRYLRSSDGESFWSLWLQWGRYDYHHWSK